VPERYAVWLDRDVVEVVGEESGPYLQGQLSQDVMAVADGASAWSWVLSPQGKVDALARVTRLSPERWLLDTDGGWGEALVARLNRFKLRTKVTLEARDWKVLGLRGEVIHVDSIARADPAWPGVEGVDLIGDDLSVPEGWQLMDGDAHEAERIRLGMPKMGAELDERTIPGETGLVPRTVSFTKGCYTGQELVARVDSRGGNVPRRLARLSSDAKLHAGSALVTAGGGSAGVLTSAAETPAGTWVALGYVKRGVDVEAPLSVDPGGATMTFAGLVG